LAPKQKPAKAANGRGSLATVNGKLFARITLPDGRRKRILLPPGMSEAKAREAAAAMAERAREGRITFDAPAPRGKKAPGPTTTVRELVKQWTSGALYEQYGDLNDLGPLAGAQINQWTLEKHVLKAKTRGPHGPEFGELRVADVTEQDCMLVMSGHQKGRRSTILKTYRRLHRIFELANFPCKLREDGTNPVTRRLRPSAKENEKVFCFLYPQEVLALLKCTPTDDREGIPVGRRILYALGVYTGLRKGSLYALKWSGIDFQNGTITALKTKTGRSAFFAGHPSLMALLKLWHQHQGEPGPEELVVADVGCQRGREAQALRADLKLAGVTRAVLFSDEPTVEPLRFHDLRATFATWARRDNMTDAWISERTGHQTGEMIDRYARAAATLRDLAYEPFPAIARAVPELAPLATALAILPMLPSGTGSSCSPENRKAPRSYLSAEPVGASGFEPPTPRPPV
jgi:integrase